MDDPQSLGKHETGAKTAMPIFKNFVKKAIKKKNARPFKIPIPWKGQLGLFDVNIPKIKNKKIIADIIDEEYRYQWIGHH